MFKTRQDIFPSPLVVVGFVFGLTILLPGCGGPADLAERLQSELASERARACIEAGQRRDTTVIPLLVERLEDDDADVRFFAILALKKITHKDMGYHYYDNYQKRTRAVRRWRNWLERTSKKRSGG